MKNLITITFLALVFFSSCSSGETSSKESNGSNNAKSSVLNVYTFRNNEADKKLYSQFEEETGIKIKITQADSKTLVQKLVSEGKDSGADVLILEESGLMVSVKDKDLLQSVNSDVLNKNIPVKYRDDSEQWYGLSKHVMALVYNKDVISAEKLSTYQALALPLFKGKLGVSGAERPHNQSLMAGVLVNTNFDTAKEWAEGIVQNRHTPISLSDADLIKAAHSGEVKVALVNSNSLGLMTNSKESDKRKIAKEMSIFWPNQETTGAHVNVSTGAVCKQSSNQDNAVKFLEFLSTKSTQEAYCTSNYDYPVNPEAAKSLLMLTWGEFKEDPLNVSVYGELNKKALSVFKASGWK